MKEWLKKQVKRKQKKTLSKIAEIIERQQEIREELGKHYEDSSEYSVLEFRKAWLYIVVRFWFIWVI